MKINILNRKKFRTILYVIVSVLCIALIVEVTYISLLTGNKYFIIIIFLFVSISHSILTSFLFSLEKSVISYKILGYSLFSWVVFPAFAISLIAFISLLNQETKPSLVNCDTEKGIFYTARSTCIQIGGTILPETPNRVRKQP